MKMKKIIASIACISVLLMSFSTFCYAETPTIEAELNRRVTFVGDTYWDWNGKKVRKDNEDTEETSGIILSINHRRSKGVFISGKGYIGEDQIIAIEGKVLEIDFDAENLESSLKFDGDYVKIESENKGVLDIKDGVLTAGGEGTTTIKLHDKKGEVIEIEAEVDNATVTLNIPEKSVDLTVKDASLVVKEPDEEDGTKGAEIINVTGSMDATADLNIDGETITVDATAKADGSVKVKGEEIIKAEMEAKADVKVDLENKTAELDANANMDLIVKDDGEEIVKAEIDTNIDANVKIEEGKVTVDANGEADGTITVKGEEFAKGEIDANVNTEIKVEEGKVTVDTDAEADGKVTVKGEEVLNAEIDANANLTVDNEGATVTTNTTQTYTLLQKIKMKLQGELEANADSNGASVEGSGQIEVNDKPLASGEASINGNYGEDPKISAEATIVDKEVVSVKEKTLPIMSILKKLLAK